eukprot:SAG11_NODE_12169_length_718_cov_0.581583_2_plen_67_part_00
MRADLRAGGLLNALKPPSEDLQPITLYQVSQKRKGLTALVPLELRTQVEKLIYHDVADLLRRVCTA